MNATYYTREHEWIRVGAEAASVGVTDYAQSQLGDVVFVEVPERGRKVVQGGEIGVVESVKAVSDVYSPASGTVIEGNQAIVEEPSLVNADAEGDGWFFKLRMSDSSELEELMDNRIYQAYCAILDNKSREDTSTPTRLQENIEMSKHMLRQINSSTDQIVTVSRGTKEYTRAISNIENARAVVRDSNTLHTDEKIDILLHIDAGLSLLKGSNQVAVGSIKYLILDKLKIACDGLVEDSLKYIISAALLAAASYIISIL